MASIKFNTRRIKRLDVKRELNQNKNKIKTINEINTVNQNNN